MILLIDAGNTRVKFGWHDGKHWICREDVAHDALGAAAEGALLGSEELAAREVALEQPAVARHERTGATGSAESSGIGRTFPLISK